MRTAVICGAIACVVVACPPGRAAGVDDLATAALAYNCYTCHGTAGRSPGEVPAIADKSAAYLEEKLREYANGAEQGTIMNRIAAALDDDQIARIAAFIVAEETR